MHDIFLSYSRTDNEIMQKVKQTFKDAGFTVWTDEGIEAGTRSWKRAIQQTILDTGCMVCILSPEAADSRWVQEELDFAELHEKPIFLILAKGDQRDSIPFGYSSHQWIDIRIEADYSNNIADLVTVINKKLSKELKEKLDLSNPLTTVKDLMPEPFDWCYVPAGEITLKQGGYVPEGGLLYQVKPFYMAQYPITNDQFTLFIQASGYDKEEYWFNEGWQNRQENKWTEPLYWKNSKWNGANQPVLGVSWYECMAFCNWLQAFLTARHDLSLTISLPTEQQWQHAAQGDTTRPYPWGELVYDRANTKESQIGSTTQVNNYPDGISPYNIYDMSGNIWEWCKTDVNTGSQYTESVNNKRAVRGGSFLELLETCRVDSRKAYFPDHRSDPYGFRICAVPVQSDSNRPIDSLF